MREKAEECFEGWRMEDGRVLMLWTPKGVIVMPPWQSLPDHVKDAWRRDLLDAGAYTVQWAWKLDPQAYGVENHEPKEQPDDV